MKADPAATFTFGFTTFNLMPKDTYFFLISYPSTLTLTSDPTVTVSAPLLNDPTLTANGFKVQCSNAKAHVKDLDDVKKEFKMTP